MRDTMTRDVVIFDWFALSMRMQVILDSSFARPGSAPIWGGKKGEFRDWTRLTHGFGENGKIAAHDVTVDDGGFINHSDYPAINIDGHDYTTRDVKEGEELTENYGVIEEVDFYEKLREKYGVIDWFIGNGE